VSVFVALWVGAGVAALIHFSRGSAKPPVGNATQPRDTQEIDDILGLPSPDKREKALRDAIDLYLNPGGGPSTPAKGLPLCLDLAVFYLEQNRLDDAEKFFARLEGIKDKPYPTLGKLGRGIVLALRSQPAESNKLFQEVFRDTPLKDSPRQPGPGAPAPPPPEWLLVRGGDALQ
jgi:hypothetical protein